VRIATWNVNSLRVRLPHLLDWLREAQPDVACLQETKTEDANFPAAELRSRGLRISLLRPEAYNGSQSSRAHQSLTSAMAFRTSRTIRSAAFTP